ACVIPPGGECAWRARVSERVRLTLSRALAPAVSARSRCCAQWPWSLMGLFLWMPQCARDAGYACFAASRFSLFGETEYCKFPSAGVRGAGRVGLPLVRRSLVDHHRYHHRRPPPPPPPRPRFSLGSARFLDWSFVQDDADVETAVCVTAPSGPSL